MNSKPTSPTYWAALPVLLAGAFMVVLDFFIVNVALPSIATDLGAGDSSLEWVVAGYGLTFAAFLITAGRLGDSLGRRRVYVIGLALFTLASAACGLAPSPTTLVAARVAQGIAGAVVMPQVLAQVAERAGRTFWINPEPRLYWNYGDSVMSAYEPFCDGVFECWTTKQLEAFVNAVADATVQ